ncbi:hypothetical protein [Kitasatospora purpeofusca]|uniref:Secreted protein n=1 Tax=Kitasatospora purpeofusca TaxID=67352 RepID=A0ABZ1TTI1_9ACTN|nr:hypothetical protein [Kitasatospora purpeofusca]
MRVLPRSAALAATAVSVAALVSPVPAATAAGTAAAPPPPAGRYLNLHQCVYHGPFLPTSFDLVTTLVPSRDGRFSAGTNISDTPVSAAVCGPGDGTYEPSVYTAAEGYDLTAGRYLNLHQCVFWSDYDQDHLTTTVGTTDVKFVAGTNVSNTRDTEPFCGGGGTDHPVPLLSSATPLDLTAGRYLNLHQCMYYYQGFRDHFTTFAPSKDGRFKAGTNISNTPDTQPSCGAGDGNFQLVPLLSGVKALPLG